MKGQAVSVAVGMRPSDSRFARKAAHVTASFLKSEKGERHLQSWIGDRAEAEIAGEDGWI
jgi:hypothetical protein